MIVKVFLASPGDTNEERKAVKEVVEEVNQILIHHKIRFEIIQWENMPPNMGRPQGVLNDWAKIGQCDLFVGILWTRFGSPTGSHNKHGEMFDSGTEEEFNIAYESWKETGKPQILFFRSIKKASPEKINTEQLAKVSSFFDEFRHDNNNPGIYKEYNKKYDFVKTIRCSLISYALDTLINQLKGVDKDLFFQYGFESLFVPNQNELRNASKKDSLSRSKEILLIAHSGYSFVAQFGHRFRNIIESRLKEGYTFKAVLTNPWTESGYFISLSENKENKANDVIATIEESNWYKIKFRDSVNGYNVLRKKFGDRIQIRLTRFEIPSSILICDEHCYIEPYLPINLEKRYEKGMLTFEVKVSNKSYLYNHNKDYFEFLWKIADDLSEFESNEQTYKNLVVNKINAVKEY